MPAFGQSLFSSVMERLKEEHNEQAETEQVWRGVKGLHSGFVPQAADDQFDDQEEMELHRLFDSILQDTAPQENAVEDVPEAHRNFDPSAMQRLSVEEIAKDLGLRPNDTASLLVAKRRQFASENHPDRVPPKWRDQANTRMKVANLLVDEAIKKLNA